jgi:hypothetical protein
MMFTVMPAGMWEQIALYSRIRRTCADIKNRTDFSLLKISRKKLAERWQCAARLTGQFET